MFRSPSSRSSIPNSPQHTGSFKRTFRTSFTGSAASSNLSGSLDDEAPLALLQVQVVSCRDLPVADTSGKSDPYVVITFGNQRYKTPVIKKNLNPKWPAKDATFTLPIYATSVETRGAILDVVVWDKDMIGKDYLAELSLGPAQWLKRSGDSNTPEVYAFDDDSNKPRSFALSATKAKKTNSKDQLATTPTSTIQLKIGLTPVPDADAASASDLKAIFEAVQLKASQATDQIFSLPASQAFGNIKPTAFAPTRQSSNGSLLSAVSSDAPPMPPAKDDAKPVKESFRINWQGTYIDYAFATKKSVAGIVLLEVQSVVDLPKTKNFLRQGWDMDPFVVIRYNGELFRTKVVRHDLNPSYNDKFILFVPRGVISGAEKALSKVDLSVLDWEQLSKNRNIGSVMLDLQPLIDDAPVPDSETGLYSPEAMRLHTFSKVKLSIGLAQKERWDSKAQPVLSVSAKYDPNGAMRQRFWRVHLQDYDGDHSGQFTAAELLKALEPLDLDITKENVDSFFTERGKDPSQADELTIEEAMICLEKDYGVAAELKQDTAAAVTAEKLEDEQVVGDTIVEDPNEESAAEIPVLQPRPPRASMFGHSRESIADLEFQLRDLFVSHPSSYHHPESPDEILVPARALPSILASFSEMHDASLLNEDEEKNLKTLVEAMPDAEIGPEFLIAFIAKATGEDTIPTVPASSASPSGSGSGGARSPEDLNADDEGEILGRARTTSARSRDSSPDSVVTSYRVNGQNGEPETPRGPSVFDVRQRSTPLETMAPPSSWSARPMPASRRRKSSTSSMGSRGGSEDESGPSFSGGPGGRSRPRAPSNPVSPTSRLPPFTFPARRNESGASSPEDEPRNGSYATPSLPTSPRGFRSLRIPGGSLSNPALPNLNVTRSASPEHNINSQFVSPDSGAQDDDDDDDEDHTRFASERTSLFSGSTAPGDRYEDLERLHEEKSKKLKEIQKTLDEKMANHELEMEEMLAQKEDIEAELASSKREEKELRLKDANSTKQLNALESEVSRLQKELDSARTSYQGLQKMYQEQCNEAEKYRDALRRKDIELKDSEKYVGVLTGEVEKWQNSSESTQHLVDSLTIELDAARTINQDLDRQKQENLSLKETIDRLRFELDELRNVNNGSGSATVSRAGTLAPSLAHEMQQRLFEHAGIHDENASEADTAVGEQTDDDYETTVITRRKITKYAKAPTENIRVQEIFKDYVNASTQHIREDFVADVGAQTMIDEEPELGTAHASTSARPHTHALPVEAPPAYTRLLNEEREKLGQEEAAKWHAGLQSTDALPQGISAEAVAEWQRVKGELGFSCLAIDEVIQNSHVRGPRTAKEEHSDPASDDPLGRWAVVGLVGAVCFLVGGFAVLSILRGRHSRFDRRYWDVINDFANIGSFPDFFHRPPLTPWSTIRSVQQHLPRPNWEPA